MKRFLTVCFIFFSVIVCPKVTEASTAASITKAAYENWINANYGDRLEAPVNLQDSEMQINGATGEGIIKETDLMLPGKNGMDVNILRSYHSSLDTTNDPSTTASTCATKVLRMRYKNAAGEKRFIDFSSEEEYFQNDKDGLYVNFKSKNNLYSEIKREDGTHVTRDKSYAPHWERVTFSSRSTFFDMEFRGGIELMNNWYITLPKLNGMYSHTDSFDDSIWYYQELYLPDGRMYSFRHWYKADRITDRITAFSGECTDSTDFTVISPVAGDPNDNKYDAEKGIYYTFILKDKDGKLYYFDLNGKLVYEEDRFGNGIKYAYVNGGLEITDTMGRVIRYIPAKENGQIGKISVTADGVTKDVIYYEYSMEDTDAFFEYNDRHFLKVKKIENSESVDMCKNTTIYEMIKRVQTRTYSGDLDYKWTLPTYLVTKITKPNNGYVAYTYEPTWNSYIITAASLNENGTELDGWTYSYNNSSFTKKRCDNYTEIFFYDYNDRIIQWNRTGNGVLEEERYVYNTNPKSYSKPTGILLHKYKQVFRNPETDIYDFIELVTNYERDERGNYSYENYMGRETWYNYGTAETNPYNFLLSKEYVNDGQKLKIENKLTEDLKSIASTHEYVMENGEYIEKNATYYEYDAYGNLKKETVLPVNDGSIESHYSYVYNGCAYSVESYVFDENNHKVATFKYYDTFGRLIREIDANGNETTYRYDTSGRLTLIQYGDGTSRAYSYDVKNNIINAVNEIGTEIKQSYDMLGREKKTTVKNEKGEFITLNEKEYHIGKGQIASVTELGANNKRIRTEYLWDDNGNAIQKVIKSENGEGGYTEEEKVTAEYKMPKETGTRILNYRTSQNNTCKEYWQMGEKYEWNCEGVGYYGLEYKLQGDYDYVLVNIRGYSPVNIYFGGDEVSKWLDVWGNNNEGEFARSFIWNVEGVDFISISGYTEFDEIWFYNFRAYTKEDLEALVSTVETVQTGDGTITPPKSETHIDIFGNQVYNSLKDAVSGDILAEEFSRFDDLGNEIAYRNPVSSDLGQDTVSRTYNHRGQVLTETISDSILGTVTTEKAYDNIGRLTSETDANGNTTSYTYDKLGRVTRKTYPISDGVTGEVRYTYDKNGNVTREEVKNGASFDKVEYAYDGKNRVVRATSYKNDSSPEITQYYYDAMGNVLRVYTGLSKPLTIRGLDDVVPNGDSDYHVTKYTYNFMGYPVKMTDSLGQEETYVTDYLGNILSKTDRNGDTVTTTYNYRGQPLSVHSSKDNKTITYTYDRLGNRTSMTDETGTTTYTYTNLSQLLSETKDGIVKTYSYDKNGNCTGFTLSDGGTVRLENTYTVGSTGVMTAAQSGTDSVAYTYDNNCNMLLETINNAFSQINTFNKANQAVSVQNKNGTLQQSLFNYTYSENGNMTAAQETLDSVSSRAFTYDGMGRLTAETRDGNTTNYTYDAYSNRASKNSESYLYDANNRLTTKTVGNAESLYNYDNNGNLYSSLTSTTATAGEEDISISESISNQDAMYTFDGLNRLTNLTVGGKNIVYVYDGDGKRVSKTVDGITTDYVWDGDYIIMEKTGDSITLYKRALRLFANEKNGVKTFYRYNARGDVAQLTNADGTVTKNYKYDAFGNELSPSANDTNPYRYCGEYFDSETGYIYLRARYYDPNIGRFISEDPIRDGLNWYVYCENNPIRYFDPTGYITQEEMDMFENGQMAPSAYSYLMRLTYSWYIADDEETKAMYHRLAEDFRRTGYTTTNGLFKDVDDGINYMPKRPKGWDGIIPITQNEHFFRNTLNLHFSWYEFKKLNHKLPENMKWYVEISSFHQHNKVNGKNNIKYVSADGHFELVYNDNKELLTSDNNWKDMGTYNYFPPKNGLMHTYYDVFPYFQYGNIRLEK